MKKNLHLNLNLNRNLVLNLNQDWLIKIKNKIMIMNRGRAASLLAIGVLLGTGTFAFAADETNTTKAATSRIDYQSFRIISERNIFNPSRSGRSDNRNYTRQPDRRRSVPAFGLIGTMSYEKGPFAFFDGTTSDYRKVLQPEDSIAGFKIAEVAPTYVILQGNGKEVHLEVGGRMTKQQENEWTVSAKGESFETFTAEGGDSVATEGPNDSGSTNATANAAPTGEASSILQRMMQKREQELK